jgi:hypothetical protein
MKYLVITLLFVISLTNSEVLLKFKQKSYKFGKLNVDCKSKLNFFYTRNVSENEDVEDIENEEIDFYYFNKEALVKELQKQYCLASTDTAGNKLLLGRFEISNSL